MRPQRVAVCYCMETHDDVVFVALRMFCAGSAISEVMRFEHPLTSKSMSFGSYIAAR